jgi:hypothetical protein
MRIDWVKYTINGIKVRARVTIPEKNDQQTLREIYFDWKKLNDALKKISTRGINIPDTLTENAFCLFFPDHVRITRLGNERCSFDCLNTKTGSKVQIKAASISPDLSSFGPKSEYDKLYFLDFSSGDGSFKVYDIPINIIKNTMVNKNQTFEQQQSEKRRPRFSITRSIVIPRRLKPIKICKL